MELTTSEIRTVILALGTAIEREKVALDGLRKEMTARDFGVNQAINHRVHHLADLERIRHRLTAEK
jgi:hypothetical protein